MESTDPLAPSMIGLCYDQVFGYSNEKVTYIQKNMQCNNMEK